MLTLAVPLMPPAISTLPLVVELDDVLSCVALCDQRPGVVPVRLPVAAQVLVAGSNSSAVASPVVLLVVARPHATSTLAGVSVVSNVAVWSVRAATIDSPSSSSADRAPPDRRRHRRPR